MEKHNKKFGYKKIWIIFFDIYIFFMFKKNLILKIKLVF